KTQSGSDGVMQSKEQVVTRTDLWGALRAAILVAISMVSSVAWASAEGSPAKEPEQTAVAIVLDNDTELPEIAAMQSWFVVDGEPQRVLAAGKGPAEVALVRDPAAQSYLDILAKAFLDREALRLEWRRAEEERRQPVPLAPSRRPHQEWQPEVLQQGEAAFLEAGRPLFRAAEPPGDDQLAAFRQALQGAFALGEGTQLRFIEAQAAPVSRTAQAMSVFNQSPAFPAGTQGFLSFVDRVPTMQFELRFADAVFIAGQDLYAQAVRRAIVLLIEGKSHDQSLYSVASVRDFAAHLQIPLFVWSFGPGAIVADWNGRWIGQRVGHLDTALALVNFEDAWEDLRQSLETQRIVWLAGRHRPSTIRLGDDARGVRLAGRPATPSSVPAGAQEAGQ
ncbi:MAG: hypothetical protein AAF657_26255, partial [Acidobacteriota bacterium]